MDVAAVERAVRLALPAVREVAVPGWVVRISGGTTQRVNSANPTSGDAALTPVLDTAERLYGEHGLPVRFRLTPLAATNVDRELERAGYETADPSMTMAADLVPREIEAAVRFGGSASSDWLEGMASACGWSVEQRRAHTAVLARLPADAIVAILADNEEPLGFGIGSIADHRCCLFDIAVVQEARGRGVGRRLVGSILGRAYRHGIRQAVLQVLTANDPARALYRSLGFTDVFPYHYRVKR